MSILSVLRSSVTTLVLLAAIAVPVHATVTTTGDVDPGGATDPWAVGGVLVVGENASGTLDVTDGGVVSNTDGVLGENAGSSGMAAVAGSGSQWNNSNWLQVGQGGIGTLNVSNGGVVSNRDGVLGYYGDSSVDAGNRSRNRSKYT